MGINFPNVPGTGSAINTPKTRWTFNNGAWRTSQVGYALPHNYAVNPAFQISQENGNNSSNVSGFYAADAWFNIFAGIPTYVARGLGAGEYNVSWTPVPAHPTVLTSEWIQFGQYIEGNRIVDLQWGTTTAKNIVVRFNAGVDRASAVGNYAFVIRNTPPTRSYIVPIAVTVASKTFEFVVPGCQDGAWPIDNTPSMNISITSACGNSLFAATNQWVNGNFIGFTGISNLAAVSPQSLGISRFGLYADPNNTGRAPPWEIPTIRQDMFDCQRYYQKCVAALGIAIANTTTHQRASYPNQAPMRIVPATALAGTMRAWDQATAPNITGIANSYSTFWYNEFNFTSASAQNLGRGAMLIDCNGSTIYIPHNARM